MPQRNSVKRILTSKNSFLLKNGFLLQHIYVAKCLFTHWFFFMNQLIYYSRQNIIISIELTGYVFLFSLKSKIMLKFYSDDYFGNFFFFFLVCINSRKIFQSERLLAKWKDKSGDTGSSKRRHVEETKVWSYQRWINAASRQYLFSFLGGPRGSQGGTGPTSDL